MKISNHLKLLLAIISKKRFIYAHFGLTHRCNFRCRMCSTWRSGNKDKEINLTQIRDIVCILKSLGIISISLGGGEPFLREDLPEIVRLFIRGGLRVRVLTNGSVCTESSIRELASVGLKEISISLDSLDPKKQNYIYNLEGAWEGIVKKMCLFSEILPKRGNTLLINTVVSRLNIEELPSLVKFAEGAGYYISFIPIESRQLLDNNFIMTNRDYALIDKIYARLIEMKKRGRPIFNSVLFLENSREYLKTGQINWQCDAGRLYLSINPEGNFSICHKFSPIESSSLKEMIPYFESEEYEFKRKELIRTCSRCMRPCWAEITYLIRNRQSFSEMAKIEISTWRKRRYVSYETLVQSAYIKK